MKINSDHAPLCVRMFLLLAMVTQFRCNAYLYNTIALILYKYITLCDAPNSHWFNTRMCYAPNNHWFNTRMCYMLLTDNVCLAITLYGIVINIFTLDDVIL